MKSNSIDKNRKNMINQIKVNIINNIPKRKPLNYFKNSKTKLIKYKTSSNHINTFKQFNNNKNNNIINDISKYISINKSLLLLAYEKSILILFENLKLYMKNNLKCFNELKENFIKNVQDIYQKRKKEFSIPNKMKEEIKIDNYINYKTSNNKNSRIKTKSNSNITFHKKNKSHYNNSMRKFFSGLSYNSINKSNTSIKNSSINNNKIINDVKKRNAITHKKSLYSLNKSDKELISNSPIKEIAKNNYKYSILNNFIDLKRINKINSSEATQNGYTIKLEKSNNGRDIYKNEEEEKNIKENCIFSNNNDMNNYITNIHNNIHNNIYYNKIISQIPNKTNSEKYILSNDLITRIKNSLDENLKGIFDFSYESFLNKETEREGN